MRPSGPTFWLINDQTKWSRFSARAERVAFGGSGLRLAAKSGGPLALDAFDGSLGGLTLPPRLAFTEDLTLYLLEPEPPWHIKRFDPVTRRFEVVPTLGGYGCEPRQFYDPAEIAIARGYLYVADPTEFRVQVFDLADLVLVKLWHPDSIEHRHSSADPWEPISLAVHAGRVYILDRRFGRVFTHRRGEHAPTLCFRAADGINRWSRLTLDRTGRIYLYNQNENLIEVYAERDLRRGDTKPCRHQEWALEETLSDPGGVRDRFLPPAIRVDHKGRFCLPESLTAECGRHRPEPPPAPESPLELCLNCKGLVFDLNGEPAVWKADEPLGPPLYEKDGVWYGQALDSEIHQCQWHRLEIMLTGFPVGSSVRIDTYSDERPRILADILALPSELWRTRCQWTAPMQTGPEAAAALAEAFECLVQSREGRYLWLRITIGGDGYGTPFIESMRVHYPRESYLQFLPAVYSAEDESRWFLERFLSIFQTEWDSIGERIEETTALFDPHAVPDAFVDYLAGWLDLPLEGDWSPEQKRRLLAAAPKLNPRRGTPDGLREFLRIYLWNGSGVSPEQQRDYPVIVEGFRERNHLMTREPGFGVHQTAELWSRDRVARLQSDVYAREGEVRLVSTGDPERDWFHEHAHRFKIFVPAAWLGGEEEARFRRAVEAEKPAHTAYQLCAVLPRFRVGIQSSVGLDTIIGGYPPSYLHCESGSGNPATGRLGQDTLLAGRPTTGRPTTPRINHDTLLR